MSKTLNKIKKGRLLEILLGKPFHLWKLIVDEELKHQKRYIELLYGSRWVSIKRSYIDGLYVYYVFYNESKNKIALHDISDQYNDRFHEYFNEVLRLNEDQREEKILDDVIFGLVSV